MSDGLATMYESTTQGVRVRVGVTYRPEQSTPEDNYYFWSYEVEIANRRPDPVRLLSRAWTITDRNGRRERVEGPGVVGKTPLIEPGESFSYTSGCPLREPSGLMAGRYTMVDSEGQPFEVEIPAFSLDSPFEGARAN